jgi:hypothetical protein
MDKENKKGEHDEKIHGIVECIVYFKRFYKKGIPNNGMYSARCARPGGFMKVPEKREEWYI